MCVRAGERADAEEREARGKDDGLEDGRGKVILCIQRQLILNPSFISLGSVGVAYGV